MSDPFTSTIAPPAALSPRPRALFASGLDHMYRRTDLVFVVLLGIEWLAAIGAALVLAGPGLRHEHLMAAVFLGGVIASLPIYLVYVQPGRELNRQVIAIAQMSFSALLIYLLGGRIETHFHIFGSLAFLAFYRDWKVLATATAVVLADHVVRGLWWPESIFGIAGATPWRALEHAGWVAFEDIFLLISMRQSRQVMIQLAVRQARLEAINTEVEAQVAQRTADLTIAHRKLVEASRQAGMAEVATGILHNVGNVLNSVGVSATLAIEQIRKSKVDNLTKIGDMLRENARDVQHFLTADPKGRRIPEYLTLLASQIAAERKTTVAELHELQKNIEHIKAIVAMQQSLAGSSGLIEMVQLTDLAEDALRINGSSFARHQVELARDFQARPTLSTDKHKIVQILINLVRNAILACDETGSADKKILLRIEADGKNARVSVRDNGVGIPAANLTRIFGHGFTTRKTGHGFGLHSSALAASELGGSLSAQSDGPGLGATFVLQLPLSPNLV